MVRFEPLNVAQVSLMKAIPVVLLFLFAWTVRSEVPQTRLKIHLKPARILPLAKESLISDLYRKDDQIYAVGERGHILNGSSVGNMTQNSSPANQFLTAITGDGHNRLWAVGHDSIILASTNFGKSWSVHHVKIDPGDPLFDILYLGGDELVAVGAYGLFLKSIDGGVHWKRISVDMEEPHFYQVKALGDHLYLCGEFGKVLKVSRDGEFLEQYDSGTEASFFGMEVIQEDEWIAYGLRGRVFHFRDGEPHRLDIGTQATLFNSMQFGGKIYFTGADGTVLSFDGKLIRNLSLKERIHITDALPFGPYLLLSTSKGFRKTRF